MRVYAIALATMLTGCASGAKPAVSTDAAAASMEPCPFPVSGSAEVEVEWRLVRADGFTFCLPASWKPSGRPPAEGLSPQTWRGPEGSMLTWGRGEPPRETVTRMELVMTADGEPVTPPATPPTEFRESRPIIGGRPARLWSSRLDYLHHTGAEWGEPVVYLRGRASNRAAATLQMVIYHTVRFPNE